MNETLSNKDFEPKLEQPKEKKDQSTEQNKSAETIKDIKFKESYSKLIESAKAIPPTDYQNVFPMKLESNDFNFKDWGNLGTLDGNTAYIRYTEKSLRPVIALQQGNDIFTFQISETNIFVRKNGEKLPNIKTEKGEITKQEKEIPNYKEDLSNKMNLISKIIETNKLEKSI